MSQVRGGQATCHPEKKNAFKGQCERCYRVERYGYCINHKTSPAHGKNGLCSLCRYPEGHRALSRRFFARNRVRALDLLGGKCAECGTEDYSVLQIDHINNDGHLEFTKGSFNFAHAIVKGRRKTDDLQLLCANCHHRKSWTTPEFLEAVAERATK